MWRVFLKDVKAINVPNFVRIFRECWIIDLHQNPFKRPVLRIDQWGVLTDEGKRFLASFLVEESFLVLSVGEAMACQHIATERCEAILDDDGVLLLGFDGQNVEDVRMTTENRDATLNVASVSAEIQVHDECPVRSQSTGHELNGMRRKWRLECVHDRQRLLGFHEVQCLHKIWFLREVRDDIQSM